jgi:hypothetical protein
MAPDEVTAAKAMPLQIIAFIPVATSRAPGAAIQPHPSRWAANVIRHGLQGHGVLVASQGQHGIHELRIDSKYQQTENQFAKCEIPFDGPQVFALGAKIQQVIKGLFVSIDWIGQPAFIPLPAGKDFGMMAFKDGVKLAGGGRDISPNFVGIQKEHAFVSVCCHFLEIYLTDRESDEPADAFISPIVLIHTRRDPLMDPYTHGLGCLLNGIGNYRLLALLEPAQDVLDRLPFIWSAHTDPQPWIFGGTQMILNTS